MDLPTEKELAGAGILTPGVLPHTFRIPVLPSTGVDIIQNSTSEERQEKSRKE